MKTEEKNGSDKEYPQVRDGSDDAISGQESKHRAEKEGTPSNESEAREQIAEMRNEMAQSQTGFTGD